MPLNAVDRIDTLPEHTVFRDDGCGKGCVRSLECPYPRCRYDEPGIWMKEGRERRDRDVLALRAAEGLGVKETAERLGISRRTVHRILAQARQQAPVNGVAAGGRLERAQGRAALAGKGDEYAHSW